MDRVPEIDEIDSRERLEAYLKMLPVDESQIIEEAHVLAFRSAVRAMPLTDTFLHSQSDFQQKSDLAAYIFRRLLTSWAAGNFPAHQSSIRVAAIRAITRSPVVTQATATHVGASIHTAKAATHLAIVSIRSSAAIHTAAAVAAAASVLHTAAYWRMVRSDLANLRSKGASSIFHSSLWEDKELPDRLGLNEQGFRRGLHDLGEHWQCVWDFYSAICEGKQPFAHLGARLEEVVVGIATENEDFWTRASDVVMQEIFQRLRGEVEEPAPIPPEPDAGPGPQYDILDGKLSIVASPPVSNEVDTQARLFERLRRDVDRLVSAAHKIDNSHPNLAFSIREYAELLDTPLEALDVTGVWAVGDGLAGFAQSFREQNRNRTLAEPLEPEVDGLLQGVIRQHGAFIMGFEEGRDLVDRADRFALDSDKLLGLEESGNRLIAELASNADLVNGDARAVFRSIKDVLNDLGWKTQRSAYAGFLYIRNAVRLIVKATVGNDPNLLAVAGGVSAIATLCGDPNMEFIRASIPFLQANAQDLLAFFSHSPEMQAYIQWVLHILR